MNHYTSALAELKAKPAHKLSEVGDQWQTPPALFWGINAVFGPFIIDLFTDGENSKCPRFYTADNNALLQDWAADLAGGKAFANPPYSRASYDDDKQAITGMRSIIAKVMAERDKGAKVVLLLKSATSEVWWPEEADHIAFVRGRISFDLPEWFIPASDKDKASSAGFAVTICVFDKQWRGQPMQYIERTTLLAQGKAIIDMIEQRASELASQSSIKQPSSNKTAIPTSLLLPFIEKVQQKVRRWPHNPDHFNNQFYQDGIAYFRHYLEMAIKDPASILGNAECPLPPAPLWTKKLLKAAAKNWDAEDAQPFSQLVEKHASRADQMPDAAELLGITKQLEQPEVADPAPETTEDQPALPSKFSVDELAEYILDGRLPFDGLPMVLTIKLYEMFGQREVYSLRSVRTALIALEEPDMVTKDGAAA